MSGLAQLANSWNVEEIRREFPILATKVHGKRLAYLDSAASAQKPTVVLDEISRLYTSQYANVHRGAYQFSADTTADYEDARAIVQKFINANSVNEIVFSSGTTGAINLVAYSFAQMDHGNRNEILVSEMEHHSNLVPWKIVADLFGLIVRKIPVLDNGEIDLDAYRKLLGPKTCLVAIAHVSNVLGTINDIGALCAAAHEAGARMLVDGSQAVMHLGVDVQALDVDFYCFTGHKIYGPNGIGVLFAKHELLDAMPPFLGGGDMISHVGFDECTWAVPPAKFEAGTPPIAEAIALGKAVQFVDGLGLDAIGQHEMALCEYAMDRISAKNGFRILGAARIRAPVISFAVQGMHPHDIATVLDHCGVAVRAGHHCAEPLMARYGVQATTRASFALYNDYDDVDQLLDALNKAQDLLL